jgi:MFS transporter, DHA1 family, multidrug resistance protein
MSARDRRDRPDPETRSRLTRRPVHRRAHALLPREQWRRNQIAVTVAAAMVFLGFTLVMPFLPFYVESLGVRGIEAIARWSGILLTVSPLLAALLGPFWGRLADRVGMKLMVQRVLFTIAAHWGLMYFATNLWQVVALRVLLGLFSGFGTMSVALVTRGCPRERIGWAVGLLQATQIFSTAIGPFFGGILAQAIGIRATFLVTFLLCSTAFLFVMVLYRDTPIEEQEQETPPVVLPQEGLVSAGVRVIVAGSGGSAAPRKTAPSFRQILTLPLFPHLLAMLFLINLVDRSLFLVVPMFIAHLASKSSAVEATAGAVISAGAFASAASAYLLGRGAGRTEPARLLAWSLAGSCACILPMTLCRTLPPFAILRVLLGLAVGGAATLAYTIGGNLIPNQARATGYSILSSAAMLGGAVGPILSGLITSLDLRASFLAGGAIYLALALHTASMSRRLARGRSAPARRAKKERS